MFDGLAPAHETVGLQRVLEEDAPPAVVASSDDSKVVGPAARVLEFDTTEPQAGSFQRWSATLVTELYGQVELHRCYAKRVQSSPDVSVDGDRASRDGVIAMWFVCGDWSADRGGGTVFCDDRGDAVICVSPRSGRLVLFDSSTGRYDLAPRRAGRESCFTLEYHFTRSAPRESRLLDSRSV